jgi:hypothetical protein
MHRCWPAVRARHKGDPSASAAGRPGVHAGTLRAACAAGASPAPRARASRAGRHNTAAGGAVACSVRSDGGPACPSGARGRACRLSMGSPRRRTSGMHSAAAPRSAAMRRLSSAARSLALASASAATDRNAPCNQDAKQICHLPSLARVRLRALRAPRPSPPPPAAHGAAPCVLWPLSSTSIRCTHIGPRALGMAPPSAVGH